jgi:hypothetical protein
MGSLLTVLLTLVAGAWIAEAIFVLVQYRQTADEEDSPAAKLPL